MNYTLCQTTDYVASNEKERFLQIIEEKSGESGRGMFQGIISDICLEELRKSWENFGIALAPDEIPPG
jgi:hypothetical protein